jgi:hypothetical protein
VGWWVNVATSLVHLRAGKIDTLCIYATLYRRSWGEKFVPWGTGIGVHG